MRGGRKTGDDRLAAPAKERVEPRHRRGAEAGRERRARTRQKIADAKEPGAGEARCGWLLEPERGDGQGRGERLDLSLRQAWRNEAELGEPRQRMRQRWPRRKRCAGAKTLGVEARLDLVQQFRLAAEKPGRAGHIEHDAVRPIERGERREAGAPVGDCLERRRTGPGIMLLEPHARTQRARVGDRHAGPKPARLRRRIDGGEAFGAIDPAPERERRVTPRRVAPPQDPVGRKSRQEDAEETHDEARPYRDRRESRAIPAYRARRDRRRRGAP